MYNLWHVEKDTGLYIDGVGLMAVPDGPFLHIGERIFVWYYIDNTNLIHAEADAVHSEAAQF